MYMMSILTVTTFQHPDGVAVKLQDGRFNDAERKKLVGEGLFGDGELGSVCPIQTINAVGSHDPGLYTADVPVGTVGYPVESRYRTQGVTIHVREILYI